MVCAEAVNDQSLCPPRSSISRALCWGIEVPPPLLTWQNGGGKGAGGVVVGGLTPYEDEERLTYLGCPLDLMLSAQDSSGYFDVDISFEETYDPLMEGAQAHILKSLFLRSQCPSIFTIEVTIKWEFQNLCGSAQSPILY